MNILQRCIFYEYCFLFAFRDVDKVWFQVTGRNAVKVNTENERVTVMSSRCR